jgi:SAM-dependent methyltransferase
MTNRARASTLAAQRLERVGSHDPEYPAPCRRVACGTSHVNDLLSSSQPGETRETERIRDVYEERERSARPHPAIQEADRRLIEERLRWALPLLRTVAPPPNGRLLDVGCGGGGELTRWVTAGWQPTCLAGTELVPVRLARARAACPGADLREVDGPSLPFSDGTFDAATATLVFSSILDAGVRKALFGEMLRVVRPGGIILVYDFVLRKPTNHSTIGMTLAHLGNMAGRPPDRSIRLGPLLQLVAVGAAIHSRLADVAMRFAPRTHRLSQWFVPSPPGLL